MIDLQLLGDFAARRHGVLQDGFRTNKVRGLLAYLALEREQAHSRSVLAELFWGDQPEKAARGNLRNALSNAKKVLGGAALFAATRKTVRISADLTTDVAQFLRLAGEALNPKEEQLGGERIAASKAVALYRGDFLANLQVDGSASFEGWALLWRETLHQKLIALLVLLAEEALARQAWDEACDWLQQQIAHDEWREVAYRQLMWALWQRGERSAALQQYERCRTTLQAALGVAPTDETNALYEQIKAARTTPAQSKNRCNLPTPATPFIGRKREQREILSLLQEPTCRLLSLIAPGGMGKTRLAIAVGQQRCPDYADGVHFVDLVGVDGADATNALIAAIAAAQEIPFSRGAAMGDQLCDIMHAKKLLLILDNMEHLLPAAGWLDTLLKAAPHVQCLVTSREPLGLAQEWQFGLQGLDSSAEKLDHNDALQLFVQAARRADPRFTPSIRDAPHLRELCQLVGGMPLALELAAMWVPLLSCREIIAELHDLLATERSHVPARQRSIRAVFDYTWRQFSAKQRTILTKLALFRGGFQREAAQQIANATLVDLLALERVGVLQKLATGRYSIHELLRNYARERLADPTTEATFADYFATWLVAQSADLHGATPDFTPIQQDWHNLTAAWRWLTANRPTRLRAMLPVLQRFFWVRSRYPEAVALLQQSAEIVSDPTLRAELQGHAGFFLLSLGQVEQGKVLLDQAVDAAPSARLYCWRARAELHLNQFVAAKADLESAESYLKHAQDPSHNDHATWHAIWGLWHVFTGGDGAIANFRRAIELLGDDVWAQALSHNDLGLALLNAGELDRARHSFETALHSAEQLGSRRFIAVCRGNLGELALRQQRVDAAEALFAAVRHDFEELGDRLCVAYACNDQGKVALLRGKSADAAAHFAQALSLSQQIMNSRSSADAQLGLGRVALMQGDLPLAQTHLAAAWRDAPSEHQKLNVLAAIGEWFNALGNSATAQALFDLVDQLRASEAGAR